MTCIDNILEYYENKEQVDSFKAKVWISNILIRLMSELEAGIMNYLEARNCIILLLNLFFNFEGPDNYTKRGKSSQDLTENEKAQLFDLLKLELNRDLNN